MFVLVEILLAKKKIQLSSLFLNRSIQFLSLQLWVFQEKYEADCKNSRVCITLKYQNSGKGILFHHFSQHGNVLCLGSPVTAIRSWGPSPQSLFSDCFEHTLHGTIASVTLQMPVPDSAVASSV